MGSKILGQHSSERKKEKEKRKEGRSRQVG
jgi:hypothetical protein